MSIKARRGPRTGVIDSCETTGDQGSLEKQSMLLTSIEPLSLQALKNIYKLYLKVSDPTAFFSPNITKTQGKSEQ